MTLHCPHCQMQIGNVTKATCAKHGPMVPRPQHWTLVWLGHPWL